MISLPKYMAALVIVATACACPSSPPHNCSVETDCCSFGPAYSCQAQTCAYNQFIAADTVLLGYRDRVCRTGSGTSGAAGSSGVAGSSGAAGSSGNNTSTCFGDPEILGAKALSQATIDRDICEGTTPKEDSICRLRDSQVPSLPSTQVWDHLIHDLRVTAGIAFNVPISVTPDLVFATSIGGGLTGHTFVVVDGKFLDILAEYSTYLVLAETGQTGVSRVQAIDAIVARHNSASGTNAQPTLFVQSSLAGTGDVQRVESYLRDFAGAILYHEYGHYWAWGCVDTLRATLPATNLLYFYPSKIEDDADLIAGVLSAKTGHSLARSQEMVDLMAYYTLNRFGMAQSFGQVAASYAGQFQQPNRMYQSLAGRKATIARGFGDYRPTVTNDCSGQTWSDASRCPDGHCTHFPPAATVYCTGSVQSCGAKTFHCPTGWTGNCCPGGQFVPCPPGAPFPCLTIGTCVETSSECPNESNACVAISGVDGC